jgi:uncharacterized membrane protein
MQFRYALPAAALLAAACGGDKAPPVVPPAEPPAAAPAPPGAPVAPEMLARGTVVLGQTVTFRSCDGPPIMTVLDSTSNRLRGTYGLLSATEEQGMFIMARGSVSPRRELILRELEFAVLPTPGQGCDQPSPDYSIAIHGVDSAWSVVIKDQAILFQNSPSAQPISFPATAPADSAGSPTYRSTTEPDRAHTLHIVLAPASCREARTGAYSPMRATVVMDTSRLSGCAWRGRLR